MQQAADEPAASSERGPEEALAETEANPDQSQEQQETAAIGQPLIAGPESVIWVGGIAIVFITAFVLLLITRGQAGRARAVRSASREFFEPAGADAEISFDEEPADAPSPSRRAGYSAPSPVQVIDAPFDPVGVHARAANADDKVTAVADGAAPAAKKARRRWFSREPKAPESRSPESRSSDDYAEEAALELAREAEEIAAQEAARRAREEYERLERARQLRAEDAGSAPDARSASTGPALFASLASANAAAIRQDMTKADVGAPAAIALQEALKRETGAIGDSLARQFEERFNALAAALEERLNAAPPLHPEPIVEADPEHALAAALSTVEEALHAQSEAIRAETEQLLTAFAGRMEARLEALTRSMPQATSASLTALSAEFASHREAVATSLAGMRQMLETLGVNTERSAPEDTEGRDFAPEEIAPAPDERAAVSGVEALGREIAGLRQAFAEFLAAPADDAAGMALANFAGVGLTKGHADSPTVQLADIVRNALPPTAYELPALLENNQRADCLVKLPHPTGPIAVDARFPVEAFASLYEGRRSDRSEAENDFRLAALRHIVDVAERLIAPRMTADCALMFLPSESMHAELHANFPDIVHDGHRARVWIVSPSTLMAALSAMRAVMNDAERREAAMTGQAPGAGGDVDHLRQRIGGLQKRFDSARNALRSILAAAEGQRRQPENLSAFGRSLEMQNHERIERGMNDAGGRPNTNIDATPSSRISAIEDQDDEPEGPGPQFPLR